ncbi:MAG TPA: hypothetical protein VGD58_30040 [Herpetosiphonaceae bacterium]
MSDLKPTSRTNWDRLRAMADEKIDYSDIPPLTSEFFACAKLVLPAAVQLDPESPEQHIEPQKPRSSQN